MKFFKKITDSAVLMSWASAFVRFGSAILVLPLILKVYSPVEQSFWFFVNTIIGFAMLADSGFGNTLVRAVSYFRSGSSRVPKSKDEYDLIDKSESKEPNLEKLRDLLTTSHRIYLFLNILVVLMLSTLGVWTIWNIMSLGHHRLDFWIAYGLIIPFSVVTIVGIKWSSFVRGLNFVAFESRIGAIFGSIRVVAFILLLSFSLKPMFLVLYMFIEAFIKVIYMRRFVMAWFKGKKVTFTNKLFFDKDIFNSLWGATWRLGLLFWGTYAIQSGLSIVISQLDDAVVMASFLFTMRIVSFVVTIARAPFYTHMPTIYSLAAIKDYITLKKRTSEYIFLGFLVMFVAFGGIEFAGNWSLSLIGIETRFLPALILGLIVITEVLDIHSSFHASIYTSTNHIPFLWPALISGALIVGLGFYILPIYGILGIVLVKFVIQLGFNNWYGPYLSLKLLNWPFVKYVRDLIFLGSKGVFSKITGFNK